MLSRRIFIAFLLLGVMQLPTALTGEEGVTAGNSTSNSNSSGEIDFETLDIFGVEPELAYEFKKNLVKAIELEEKIASVGLRQGEYGGVNGGYYQQGGGGGGGYQGGPGGAGAEDEDEDSGNTMPGRPAQGLLSWISGLFGVATGIGTLNPNRVLQSAVNFFPASTRPQIQMVVDSFIGYVPPENRTVRPRPRTPPTRPTELYSGDNSSRPLSSSMKTPYAVRPKPMVEFMMAGAGGVQMVTPFAQVAQVPATAIPTTSTTPNEDDEDELDSETVKPSMSTATLGSTVVSPPPLPPAPSTTPRDEDDDYDAETVKALVENTQPPQPAPAPVPAPTAAPSASNPVTAAIIVQAVTVPSTTPGDDDDEDIDEVDVYANFKPDNNSDFNSKVKLAFRSSTPAYLDGDSYVDLRVGNDTAPKNKTI